ncbi:hypothetical protein [Xanthomonas bundabergensis]|uniref:hypothetical protein n=1 Tax=Xanthomonas bundabergensis TaxID=3160842 RepID=UPI003513836D
MHPASVGAGDAKSAAQAPLQPSSLPLAMRRLESQLGMLLATFHDDAGFWPAFARLMQDLDDGLAAAERARLRSHADFLLVRAGMSSWTLIAAAQGAATRAAAAPARRP